MEDFFKITAPIIIRKISHLYKKIIITDGGDLMSIFFKEKKGTKNIAINPLSSTWLSQPKEYHVWPILTIE